jgi:hypothetical protein
MYLILYILFLVILLNLLSVKEPFISSDKSIVSTIMNASPNSILEGMYKKAHPYIPFKNRYYKLRRHLRLK